MTKTLHEVVDDAVESIRNAARAEARSDAVGIVNDDPALIRQVVNASAQAFVSGVPFACGDLPPLTVTIEDTECGEIYRSEGLIDYAIEVLNDYDGDDLKEKLELCISSLQGGIDQLRAYEAQRRKAQP